ncbi:MAG: hypothetical protein HS111_29015 [Kofleriaceae bacterium]|nr:hypothetical protein [Kofleriaceae bacterium]
MNGRPFYEFTIRRGRSRPAGRRVRVLVGLPNLDFFAPYAGPLEGVQESDGLGSEQHRTTSGYVATMTATFYERWRRATRERRYPHDRPGALPPARAGGGAA